MKTEKYFIYNSWAPLMTGSIILSAAINDLNFIHLLAMLLLFTGGICVGIGLKSN